MADFSSNAGKTHPIFDCKKWNGDVTAKPFRFDNDKKKSFMARSKAYLLPINRKQNLPKKKVKKLKISSSVQGSTRRASGVLQVL